MAKTAFVTGATGCVGRQLVEKLLADRWNVVALVLSDEPNPFAGKQVVRTVEGDVNSVSPEMIPDNAVVFHLAAKVHSIPTTASEHEEFFTVNRDGTSAIARAAREKHAKGFVFVSTIAVYGDLLNNSQCNERTTPAPKTTYGRSKLEAEQEVFSILKGHTPAIVLRPCIVYGPGDKGNFGSLVNWIVNKRIPVPMAGRGAARKNTLYVRNLAGILQYFGANCSRFDGEIFSVADPGSMTMSSIIEMIARIAGTKARVMNIPDLLIRPMARLGDIGGKILGRELPLSSRKLSVLTSNSVIDTTKLYAAMGDDVEIVSFEEGLREYMGEFY